MVSYKCERCKKVFNRKQTYKGHISRKNKCDEVCDSIELKVNSIKTTQFPQGLVETNTGAPQIPTEIIQTQKVDKRHICANCGKEFSRSDSLSRHKSGYCKTPTAPVVQEDKINLILEKMDELKKENQMLKQRIEDIKPDKQKNTVSGDVVMGNKSGDTTNNTVNNVNVIAFNSNDWESVMTEEACKRILRTGFKAVPNLVEHIHLNKGFPALHNCYITNFRGKHAMTYDGESWKLVEASDIIEKLREDKQDYLELKFDEYRKSLDDVTIKRFDKFLVEKDTDVVINQQKEDIKLLLYNNNSMIKKGRR
jgi:DNA-directed RNA polymerase subunit RPC12/RpoP